MPRASVVASLGLDTVLVDGGDGLGGTCLNVGCIPSKAIIHAASKYETVRKTTSNGTLGITASAPAIDLSKTVEWKDGIVKKLNAGVAALLKKAKVKVVKSWAEFTDAKTCRVETADGPILITAEHVILGHGVRAGRAALPAVWRRRHLLDRSPEPAGRTQEAGRRRRRLYRPGAGHRVPQAGRRGRHRRNGRPPAAALRQGPDRPGAEVAGEGPASSCSSAPAPGALGTAS